jgi:hypothetical protein
MLEDYATIQDGNATDGTPIIGTLLGTDGVAFEQQVSGPSFSRP